MISSLDIGYNGRLGNQMFQYAALVGFATKAGVLWAIPEQNSKIRRKVGTLGYEEMFELDQGFELRYAYLDEQPKYSHYEDGGVHTLPNKTCIFGYFQSEKYFIHCKQEILKQFTFRKEIVDRAKEIVFDAEDCVSVHVRRGDYVNNQSFHPLLDKAWYEKAMTKFGDEKFIFFSDDIQWCREQFGDSHKYCQSGSGFVDMNIMSRCKGHIIANSSFSWWGAYLGGNKTIAPKKWFGESIDHKNDGSIYATGWEIL